MTKDPKQQELFPLNVSPRPLIFSSRRIVLSFAPKSACSHVIMWFWLQEQLFHAALYYSQWPHDFRNEVYYDSARYEQRAKAFLSGNKPNWTLIKVTRDPAKRLVSQFRHCLRYNIIDPQIRNRLGREMSRDTLSFAEFVSVLNALPLQRPSTTDPHVCAQSHPVWKETFGRTITVNVDNTDLSDALSRIEQTFDLRKTDLEAHPQFTRITKAHYSAPAQDQTRIDAVKDWGNFGFSRASLRDGGVFPKDNLLSLAQKVVGDLYPDDIASTQTSDTLGTLFSAETA